MLEMWIEYEEALSRLKMNDINKEWHIGCIQCSAYLLDIKWGGKAKKEKMKKWKNEKKDKGVS